jgi:PQQ-dependent catabolism-associated CXXCW motif protein
MWRGAAVLVLCLAAGSATECVAQSSSDEPAGYRTDNYRAPVPATLQGARVVDTETAETLWREKSAIFIDVLPRPVKPDNLPASVIWREPPHKSIPDAVWLANVGYGVVPEPLLQAFQAQLATHTGGEKARMLVFFCRKDCWMSWNAAKRAVSWGYRNVAWFPDGIDGWIDALLPLVDVTPAL